MNGTRLAFATSMRALRRHLRIFRRLPARVCSLLFIASFGAMTTRALADDVPRADAFRAFPLTTDAARALVAAAFRASGLGTNDTNMDSLASSAHASAWLPEVRLQVERDEDDHSTFLIPDPTRPYQTSGFRMAYQARLSWRLDRLFYTGDEPQIEHLRVVRIEARERLAHRTLEAFFTLERELAALSRATPGTLDAQEHAFRAFEAAATLDVLTSGWFGEALRGAH